MASISELIFSRRTVHSYLPEAVPPQVLEEAIECAVQAPNHRLTFPWRFFHLGPAARAALAELQPEGPKRKRFLSGGELLVVAIPKNLAKPEVEEEDYASLACGLQNMSLYLWDKGYGTKWSTGAITRHERVYELINSGGTGVAASPETLKLCGFFWIGRPEVVPDKTDRPSLDKFLFHLP